jgi:hypothetical protein
VSAGSGYLAALASRTLGRAPVLRPVTPSRFEPDRPQLGFAEAEVTQDTTLFPGPVGWTGTGTGPARTPREWPAERGADTEAAPGAPLLGPVPARGAPDPGRAQAEALLEHEGWPAAGSPGTGQEQAAPLTRDERRRGGVTAPSPAAEDGPSRPAGTAPNEPGERGDRSRLLPEPGGPADPGGRGLLPAGSPASRGARREAPAAGAGHPAPGAAEPTIIVRIGRLDVRALQVPVPPPAAPPRRPPPGPSLEEHLRARDRARSARG